jgi:hypothetical protein
VKNGTGVNFAPLLPFPAPILVPLTVPHSFIFLSSVLVSETVVK